MSSHEGYVCLDASSTRRCGTEPVKTAPPLSAAPSAHSVYRVARVVPGDTPVPASQLCKYPQNQPAPPLRRLHSANSLPMNLPRRRLRSVPGSRSATPRTCCSHRFRPQNGINHPPPRLLVKNRDAAAAGKHVGSAAEAETPGVTL
ncbi:hypothetical protein MKEN_00483900 [Mycena kentingensis (nom. inval.)]|nr:hypothetical protein MKEN_00483900 [Mycena kentingensis (nom. inval.)]